MFLRVLIVAMCGPMFIGCAAVSSKPEVALRSESRTGDVWVPPSLSGDPRFANAGQILEGFDPLEPRGGFELADQVLLSVQLEQNGRRDDWLVRLQVSEIPQFTMDESATDTDTESPVRSSLERAANREAPGTEADDPTVYRFVQKSSIRLDDGTQVFIESPLVQIEVSVFDLEANHLATSTALVPEAIFTEGPFESCHYLDRFQFDAGELPNSESMTQILSESERREFGRAIGLGILSMLSFFETIQRNDALSVLRSSAWNEIARHPSLLSIATNLGIRISIEPQFHKAERGYVQWPGSDEQTEAFVFPTIARANDQEAVHCRIVAMQPTSPVHLCAGMVLLEASHPTKPQNVMRVQLIAARRGG